MKKILGILFLSSLLLACNSSADKEHSKEANAVTKDHEHVEKASELVLNNGVKWKADSTTLANAANLQTIIAAAKNESLDDYLQTSKALESAMNKMVTECKMQGADHDALHKWLEPLIEKTKELSKATAPENVEPILHELEIHVNLFPQYFEK